MFFRRWIRKLRPLLRRLLVPFAREIRVQRHGGLGDILMCTPALRRLKEINPRCRVVFYTAQPLLLEGLPYIDEVVPSKQTEKAIYLNYEFLSGRKGHLAAAIGRSLGVDVQDTTPDVARQPAKEEEWRQAWARLAKPHVIVQVEGSPFTPNKDWPKAYWRELIGRLSAWATVIRIGAEADDESLGEALDLRGRTTTEDLIGAIAAADVIVGPVSGPFHIAAAVRTPAVAVVGGYEMPEHTAYATAVSLGSQISCAPCWLKTPCPLDKACLHQILPDEVEQAIRSLLGEREA